MNRESDALQQFFDKMMTALPLIELRWDAEIKEKRAVTKKQIRQTKAELSDELAGLRQIMQRQLATIVVQREELDRLRSQHRLVDSALKDANLESQKMDVERERMAKQLQETEEYWKREVDGHVEHEKSLSDTIMAVSKDRDALQLVIEAGDAERRTAIQESSQTIIKLRDEIQDLEKLCAALRTQRDGWIKFFHQESTLWQRIMRCGPNLKYLK